MQKIRNEPDYLFYVSSPIYGYRDRSNHIGWFFESCTKNLLNLERLHINSNDEICPDLRNSNRDFFVECKAGREDNGLAIKVDQYKYYKEYLTYYFPSVYEINPVFNISLYYAFWVYNKIDFKGGEYPEQIQEILSKNIKKLYLINFKKVTKLIKNSNAKKCVRIRVDQMDKFTKKHKITKASLTVGALETNTFDIVRVD